jgi:hypothetical protein
VTISTGYPVAGPWAADDATSKWISPNGNEDTIEPSGTYVYQTTFDLTGLNPTTAEISGSVWVDNEISDIILNSTDTGFTSDTYASPTSFTLDTGFVSGINILEFDVVNGPLGGAQNPTGLRVEMTGTATAVPEPVEGSLLMIGAGLLVRRQPRYS